MARMPGAIWRPLAANWASQPRMRAYDFFCLHTMVGSLAGTDGYFKVGNGTGYGGTESHFGVGPDGTIYQWQDTDFQADANGDGNWHVISSENADTGAPFPKWGGSDVPALTPEQVEGNARIAAWLNQTHGIPLDLVPDSKPGRRGLAVHRYGVPGYMVAGAERWSTAPGKACPGDRRIAQAPQISARAKQIRGGAATNSGGFLMALTDAQQEELHLAVQQIRDVLGANGGLNTKTEDTVAYLTRALPQAVQAAVWSRKVERALPDGTVVKVDALQELADAKTQAIASAGQVAGLQSALAAAQAGRPVDLDAVTAAAKAGAEQALKGGVKVTIDVPDNRSA